MCKRIILEDSRVPSGKLMVITISANRDEMRAAVRSLAKKDWVGRVLYYEGSGRGGIDVYVEGMPTEEGVHQYRVYASFPSQPWGESVVVAREGLVDYVEMFFQRYPLKESAPSKQANASTEDEDEARTRSQVTAFVPRPTPGQQLSLL